MRRWLRLALAFGVAGLAVRAWRRCRRDVVVERLILANRANNRTRCIGMEAADLRRIGEIGAQRWRQVETAQAHGTRLRVATTRDAERRTHANGNRQAS